MRKSNITPTSLDDRSRGRTDWAAVDRLSDEAIAERVAADPDAAPLDLDWAAGEPVVPARKVAISIRLDRDLVEHFKRGGDGYQSRINAVLRAYVEARGKGDRA
ncbi:BrnA antitoxin family protein [Methylobacterium sp. J-092]|uniref:BrnA antitoxin family protein n=1 Tax=Methylobacterium sp. J-092 TaxID=2836667 RepID=UPI001FBA998F|nr:BrnA antitoxin family protein [Methylobacterium sp. J-092]MCJ2009956.1 BrnA antitoxin family protein [Methylobacterium sp. J-092]